MHKLWNRKKNNNFRVFVNRLWNWEFIVDAKATDSFRDRNLSANYSCGLLRLRLESDWSQNNKHSRNNFRRSWFNGFHCNKTPGSVSYLSLADREKKS